MSEIIIDVEGVKRSLYFGMDAYQIFAENSVRTANDDSKGITTSNAEGFAVIVYAGLFNGAILDRVNKPTFKEAYLIAQNILIEDDKLVKEIYDTWTGSIADKEVQRVIASNSDKKKIKKTTSTK